MTRDRLCPPYQRPTISDPHLHIVRILDSTMKLFQLSMMLSTAAAVTIPEWANYFRWTAPGPDDGTNPHFYFVVWST